MNHLLLCMELRIFPEFQGKIHCAFIILCFLGSQYLFYTLLNCYLGWISEDGRKKKIQIFTFLFLVCIFQPSNTNPWVKDIFSWRLFCVKRRMLAALGSGIHGKGMFGRENPSNELRSSPSVPPGALDSTRVFGKSLSQLPNFPGKHMGTTWTS